MALENLWGLSQRIKHLEQEEGAHWLSWSWRLIFLAVAMYFQPDGIIIMLTIWGWAFWPVFIATATYANLQLVYYFYFAGWIGKEVTKKAVKVAAKSKEFKKDLAFTKKNKLDLTLKGMLSKANTDYVIERYHDFTQKEHAKIELAKNGSLLVIFGWALTPAWGSRSIPTIAFGTIHLKRGLYTLMTANTLRILYMTGLLAMLKRLLGANFKWFVAGLVVLGVVIFFFKMIWPYIKANKSKNKKSL